LLMICFPFCVLADGIPRDFQVITAEVTGVSGPPPFGPGLVKTWVAIHVRRDSDSSLLDLLLLYVPGAHQTPRVGEHCIFNVHVEKEGGYVGREIVSKYDAWVVDQFRCDSPSAASTPETRR
jgi:hypothetical protein